MSCVSELIIVCQEDVSKVMGVEACGVQQVKDVIVINKVTRFRHPKLVC